jgi:hypothetical protein
VFPFLTSNRCLEFFFLFFSAVQQCEKRKKATVSFPTWPNICSHVSMTRARLNLDVSVLIHTHVFWVFLLRAQLHPDDILEAVREAEFDEFVEPMKEALVAFKTVVRGVLMHVPALPIISSSSSCARTNFASWLLFQPPSEARNAC